MNSYDLVPYVSNTFAQSRPEQLAFMGRLFGIDVALPSRARVLEIGCASGGNLLPMAFDFPSASFVGVDASARQIEAAVEAATELGLHNLRFETADISQWQSDGQAFDYIICHGVYSWVAPQVQEGILAAVRAHLAPGGVAYISYNTYPGWKMKEAIRDAMLFHAGQRPSAEERIQQARAFATFLKEVNDKTSPFAQVLEAELRAIAGAGDSYLFHEHLEEHNRPCYFHEFIARAQAHELAFLGEARLPDMAPQRFGKEIHQTIDKLSAGNILATEQYMDFVRNRAFRHTLLVRADTVKAVDRHVSPEKLRRFFISAGIQAGGPLNLEELVPMSFRSSEGVTVTARAPVDKAALWVLAETYPGTLSFDEWAGRVQARLGRPIGSASLKGDLGRLVLELALNGSAVFDLEAPPPRRDPALPPQALAPARRQALAGSRLLAARRGVSVKVDDLLWTVLRYADGQRDIPRIAEAVAAELAAGALKMQVNAPSGTPPEVDLNGLVRGALATLDKVALLQ